MMYIDHGDVSKETVSSKSKSIKSQSTKKITDDEDNLTSSVMHSRMDPDVANASPRELRVSINIVTVHVSSYVVYGLTQESHRIASSMNSFNPQSLGGRDLDSLMASVAQQDDESGELQCTPCCICFWYVLTCISARIGISASHNSLR